MYTILIFDAAICSYVPCAEGAFPDCDSAIEFARNEVGLKWMIVDNEGSLYETGNPDGTCDTLPAQRCEVSAIAWDDSIEDNDAYYTLNECDTLASLGDAIATTQWDAVFGGEGCDRIELTIRKR